MSGKARGGADRSLWNLGLSVSERVAGIPRYATLTLVDALFVALAFYVAYTLRFEGRIPPHHVDEYWSCLPLLLALRLAVLLLLQIHRWSFRFSGLYEATRLALAALAGTVLFVTVLYFIGRPAPPRSVIAIELFVSLSLMGLVRFSPRLAHTWMLQRARPGRVRTIIVGAGSAGDLLLRDLLRSREHPYDIVGFVDDQPAKHGTNIGGRPVLGSLDDLRRVVRARKVSQLLFAIPRLRSERLREVLAACSDLKLGYKILPVSFAYLNDRVSAAMLHDLSPEDLLPRSQATFDQDEMRSLIQGRRVLVTGAGGSIGSEICRQVASWAPQQLVLLDMNENELYFLYRDLRQRFPAVDVRAEVADVRDPVRLEQLAERYKPQDLFHAAAHKHVPLMEFAPAEAVKNNVVGCQNVARMAEVAGAERFVLISTDKAVNPSSVMGATKRIAELIVRQHAQTSRTHFTTVRFGNVLGSAGSAVPLFKAQIAAGGPVTVTHPDCTRYLMTISEAVGLVLMSGLGRFGGLCILEMGEPMRILDLARLMITLSGMAPEREIPIVFTGLRPGEKLEEELMTEAERASSRRVRECITVVEPETPPADLDAAIARMAALANAGDREGVIRALAAVVPSFTPDTNAGSQAP